MTLDIALTLVAVALLLILSAFFNASETSLTASSRARMHALEQEGNSKARLVNQLLRQPEKLIGAVLLGNTLVDILAASLASGFAVVLVGPAGVAYATAIMTILIVVFAAVLPKTYALAFADRVALFVAPIMRVIIVLLGPIIMAIQYCPPNFLKAHTHAQRRRCQHPSGARRNSWHHRAAGNRRGSCQGRRRHARRCSRPQGAAGSGHHGASHEDANDQR